MKRCYTGVASAVNWPKNDQWDFRTALEPPKGGTTNRSGL